MRGYDNPIFEPYGNCIPDFAINENIAVEVTKLTKGIEIDGETKVIDSDQPQIYQSAINMLNRLDTDQGEETWFVGFDFKRPIQVRENLKKAETYLQTFYKSNDRKAHSHEVSPSLRVDLVRGDRDIDHNFFELGSFVDFDQSGFVLSDLCKNISRVASIKEAKAKKCQSKFSGWWLLLPNTISYTLKESYLIEIGHSINQSKFWDKITLFDPSNPSRYWDFEF